MLALLPHTKATSCPPHSGAIAPGLRSSQKKLEKHMRADSLDKALKERPDKDDLLGRGMLKAGAC